MGRRVLLTGGAGYIGSHVAVALVDAGFDVVILDNLSRGRLEAIERAGRIVGVDIPLHVVDLCDTDAVTDVLKTVDPYAVIHVAAYKSVSESVAHPERYERNNVQATDSLATAMERAGVSRVVYASTGSVYGDRTCDAFHETDPTDPINPYASTKLGGEDSLGNFAGRTSAHVACMRFFNVVGAHPSAELGEFGDESTNLLPILMDQLNGKRDSVTIFGTDWDTVDGTCIRDYVHVCDIASALVAALVHIDSIDGKRLFNVGTGIGTSVRALIHAVQDAAGAPINAIDGPRREGDPGVSVAGVARITGELGWVAAHDVASMVQTALAWNEQIGRAHV